MKFVLDKQTVRDLELFEEEKSSKSVFRYYNFTKTLGGRNFLYDLMLNPLTDINEIKQRQEIIQFFHTTGLELKITKDQFDFIEYYLRLNVSTLRNNAVDALLQSLSDKINPGNDYYLIRTGVQNLLFLFNHLKEIIDKIHQYRIPNELIPDIDFIKDFFGLAENKDLYAKKTKISCVMLNRLDNRFRKRFRNEVMAIVKIIYSLDAIIAVAKAARLKNLNFPQFIANSHPRLSIKGLFHPLLDRAIPYNIKLAVSETLCFLSGPNMAGKSTFLKSLGIAVYLSHLGFPVPALEMKTTLYHGLITTINLSDNTSRGYSHFYNEVKRVKETALMLKERQYLFVIFDELFRGTNVRDAFEASLLIIKAFAKIRHSTFFVSTHLIEIAEEIKNQKSIRFMCFDSRIKNNEPVYSYNLHRGISYKRLGMHILQQENIMEILNTENFDSPKFKI